METDYFSSTVKLAQRLSFMHLISLCTINECQTHTEAIFTSGLQDKSVPWKKDMKLFNAWKGLDHNMIPIIIYEVKQSRFKKCMNS